MNDIIVHQEVERHGLVLSDRTRDQMSGSWHVAEDVGQVLVVVLPKVDKLLPIDIVKMLHIDPVVLIVGWKDQRLGFLSPNKTLVIVAGGVDQMAKHLLDRPAIGRGTISDNCDIDVAKLTTAESHHAQEFVGDGIGHGE